MKLLLCGFGSIGRRHFANARRLIDAQAQWTIAEPVEALHDPQLDGNVQFVRDVEAADGPWDVAFICSPTSAHRRQLELLLPRCRAVFVEKPLADSLTGLEELVAAAARHRVLTMVGCNYRFEPGLLALQRELHVNSIGRVLSVRAEFGQYLPSWRPTTDYRRGYSAQKALGGGVILDRIHEFDYLMWLFGGVDRVLALSGKLSTLEIDTEDTAEVLLRFASGAIGSVHLDYLQREYTCALKIVGDAGSLRWRFKPTRSELLGPDGTWRVLFDDPSPDVNEMYVAELRHFFDHVRRGAAPTNGLAEAAETLRIALTAKEAR